MGMITDTQAEATDSPSSAVGQRVVIWNLPNILTLSRLGLAVILFAIIQLEQWAGALAVFIIAAFTDWLDGYLARRQGLTSTLGRNLDPLVDKVLVCGAFIFLLQSGQETTLSPWIVTIVVARELVVTGLRSFFEAQGISFGADRAGKIKMVLQCAALIAILLVLAMTEPLRSTLAPIRTALVWLMTAATLWSGAQYLIKAAQHIRS